jgi:hypothetical protein
MGNVQVTVTPYKEILPSSQYTSHSLYRLKHLCSHFWCVGYTQKWQHSQFQRNCKFVFRFLMSVSTRQPRFPLFIGADAACASIYILHVTSRHSRQQPAQYPIHERHNLTPVMFPATMLDGSEQEDIWGMQNMDLLNKSRSASNGFAWLRSRNSLWLLWPKE